MDIRDVCEDVADCEMSEVAAIDVGPEAPAGSVKIGWARATVVDDDDELSTTVSIMSELVGTIRAGGIVGTAAACEDTTAGSLDCKGTSEVDIVDAGADGSRTASEEDVATGMRIALPVPITEDTAACDVGRGTTTDWSTREDDTSDADGGGGGGGGGGVG